MPAPPKLAALFTVSAFTVAAKAGNDFLRFMKMLYRSIFLFALALLMGALTSRDARAIDTLRARLQTKLCPEYPRGGVIVELRYRVGINTALLPANVLSQVVDAATNTATFDIELPVAEALSNWRVRLGRHVLLTDLFAVKVAAAAAGLAPRF